MCCTMISTFLLTVLTLIAQGAADVPQATAHTVQLPCKTAVAGIPLYLTLTSPPKGSLPAIATQHSIASCSRCQQATVAVLMLAHQGVPHSAVWKQWEQQHNGSLTIWVHNRASSKLEPAVPGSQFIEQRLLTTSVKAGWGDIIWVAAMIQSMGEILSRCNNVQHIAVVSGVDIPLQILGKDNLPPVGISYFNEFPDYEGPANWLPFLRKATQLPERYISSVSFHHNWPILSVEAAAALVHNYHQTMSLALQLLPLTTNPKFHLEQNEIVPLTMLRYMGHSSSIRNVGTTALHFPRDYVTRHPYTWSSLDGEVNTTFYKRPMTLRRLLDVHRRAQQRRSSTYVFLRKVHVEDASQGRELLHILQQLWSE